MRREWPAEGHACGDSRHDVHRLWGAGEGKVMQLRVSNGDSGSKRRAASSGLQRLAVCERKFGNIKVYGRTLVEPSKAFDSCCAFFLSIAHAAGACKGRTFVRERASKCRPARKVAKKMVQKMAHVLGSHVKARPLNANAASMAPVESGKLYSCRPSHRKPPRCPAAPWFGPSWGGCPCRRQHDREKAVVPDRDR